MRLFILAFGVTFFAKIETWMYITDLNPNYETLRQMAKWAISISFNNRSIHANEVTTKGKPQ
jgi:hypothetical protein